MRIITIVHTAAEAPDVLRTMGKTFIAQSHNATVLSTKTRVASPSFGVR